MLGQELDRGLWRWTAHHREWKKEVASFAVESGPDLVLIDPLLVERQWEAPPSWPAPSRSWQGS